jgi:hypothetical protein
MIRKSILLLTLGALALALPASALAAKGAKVDKAARQAAHGYDANGNGSIDGDEVAAIQKAYEADKTGALKAFDTNNDGKLDATEVAAIKAGGKKKKK